MNLDSFLIDWRQSIERLAREHSSAWREGGLPDVFASDFWGGAASPAEVCAAETRLGMTLPSDYAEFIEKHNGWPLPGFGYDGYFLRVESIGKLSVLDPDVFHALPTGANGPLKRQKPSDLNSQATWAADKDWLGESVLLTSDNFNNSDMVLLVPLACEREGWIEYWIESSRDGVTRFDSFFALLRHMRDGLLTALPFQIGIS